MKRMIIWVLLSVSWQMFFVSAAGAQSRPSLEKLRATYSAIGSSQSSLWIPYEAGIFRKYGLDVELLYVAGGSRAAQVVLSREVPVGMFNGGSVISADLSGGDLATVASGMNVVPFFLVTLPEIKQVEDLKGKKIGITRFGSSTDFALRYAARKWPIRPERDFAVIQLGGQPEMMAALKGKSLQAAMLNAEFTILARREGYKDLVDISALGLSFPTSSLNTTRSFIRSHEDTMRRFVRAYVEGIHYAKTHRPFSIEVFKKYLKNEDINFLDAVYEMYILRFIPKVPHPSPEALKTVLSQIGETDPRVKTARPEQFIEARFMQELEKEGFIQELWK